MSTRDDKKTSFIHTKERRNSRLSIFTQIDMRGGKDACWPWQRAWGGRPERPRPYFYVDGGKRVAYRVVYELVHGVKLPDNVYVLHHCDNGGKPIGCCNPRHLYLGNNARNVRDRVERHRQGMPPVKVRNIRRLLARGHKQRIIAKAYGISRETVSAIKTERVHTEPVDYPSDDVMEYEDELEVEEVKMQGRPYSPNFEDNT